MPVTVHVEDGKHTGRKQHVTIEGAALTTSDGSPPLLPQHCHVFRDYLRDTAGAFSMDVAGALNAPHNFYIAADPDDDRYITAINFYAGYGGTANLYHWFDSGAALANGCQLYYETEDGLIYIHDAITTNSALLRLCVTGIMRTDWQSRNFLAVNDYGFICSVDFLRMMPPYGIKLDRGTTQKLVFAIRDNITAATDVFNCTAHGFNRFE